MKKQINQKFEIEYGVFQEDDLLQINDLEKGRCIDEMFYMNDSKKQHLESLEFCGYKGQEAEEIAEFLVNEFTK